MPTSQRTRSAPARGRTALVPPPERQAIPSFDTLRGSTVPQLRALATSNGLKFTPAVRKAGLVSLLDAARDTSSPAGPPLPTTLSAFGSLGTPPSSDASSSNAAPPLGFGSSSSSGFPSFSFPRLDAEHAALERTIAELRQQLAQQASEQERVPGTPPHELLRLAPSSASAVQELPSSGESSTPSDVSDVELRTSYVPDDLRSSLSRAEYQCLSDWTYAGLRDYSSRKNKSDNQRQPEHPLSTTLWIEACFNIRRCLLTLSTAAHTRHAEQLLGHLAHVIQALNAGHDWRFLQTFDKAVRQYKAQDPNFDLGNPSRCKETFEATVSIPAATAATASSLRLPPRSAVTSSSRLPPSSPSSRTSSSVCFRCGSRGHVSSSCSNTPRSRPAFDGPPDTHMLADSTHSGICHAFNTGNCTRQGCTRKHCCVLCYDNHACTNCPSSGASRG